MICLIGAVANYTSVIANRDRIHQDYVSNHTHTDSEYDDLNSSYNSLQSSYNAYVSSHHWNESEYGEQFRPYLVMVDMKFTDNAPGPWWNPYPAALSIKGYFFNVNKNWAYQSRLHVVACYASSGAIAIDRYIDLSTYVGTGTIPGEFWAYVEESITYVSYGLVMPPTVSIEWVE